MDDLPDYELDRTEEPPVPPRASVFPIVLIVTVVVLVVAASVALYIAFEWQPRARPADMARAPSVETNAPPVSLGKNGATVTLPSLDASDVFVRTLVGAVSTTPTIMAWLTTKGLIRNFVVVVTNIADGATPARHLQVWRPSGSFRVVRRDAVYVDPRNDERYTQFADAITTIDPAAASRLYATLKPRISEAYRDMGSPDSSFDRTLERAIVLLLQTPTVAQPIRVEAKGIGYGFADGHLESLTAAQKQLLRMGPHNVSLIKRHLRSLGLALGIPPTRLPPE